MCIHKLFVSIQYVRICPGSATFFHHVQIHSLIKNVLPSLPPQYSTVSGLAIKVFVFPFFYSPSRILFLSFPLVANSISVRKFLTLYGTLHFITVFTKARHLSVTWGTYIQSSPHNFELYVTVGAHNFVEEDCSLQVFPVCRWCL